jgi:hypothetical protein
VSSSVSTNCFWQRWHHSEGRASNHYPSSFGFLGFDLHPWGVFTISDFSQIDLHDAMVSGEQKSKQPLLARRNTFQRMLDLERKNKVRNIGKQAKKIITAELDVG